MNGGGVIHSKRQLTASPTFFLTFWLPLGTGDDHSGLKDRDLSPSQAIPDGVLRGVAFYR